MREDVMREDVMREDVMREDVMREDVMREGDGVSRFTCHFSHTALLAHTARLPLRLKY